MESYKTICSDCGHTRFWTGYKTGLGKSPEQLKKMSRDQITCIKCGSLNAQTEVDRESENGKIFGAADDFIVNAIADAIAQKSSSMLEKLHRAEYHLPSWLQNLDGWESMFVDYHPPVVERLWRCFGNTRVYLHRIHPCAEQEALFHPHPWPSAMKILNGKYEMITGCMAGENPVVASKLVLVAGSEYEMTDINAWHSVRPLDQSSLSVMITGLPWNNNLPKPLKRLSKLPESTKKELITLFQQFYPIKET